ncbi:hypothetical protein OH77DRAFT_1416885 [Trametes cingulata]|nr:hypothetical protein OH77DRAFT_1416885 [Trametes cingulata]
MIVKTPPPESARPVLSRERYERVVVVEEFPSVRWAEDGRKMSIFMVAAPPLAPLGIGSMIQVHLLCAEEPGAVFPRDAGQAVAVPLRVAGRIEEGRLVEDGVAEYVVRNEVLGAEVEWAALRVRSGKWREDKAAAAAAHVRSRNKPEEDTRNVVGTPRGNPAKTGAPGMTCRPQRTEKRPPSPTGTQNGDVSPVSVVKGGPRPATGGTFHVWSVPGYAGREQAEHGEAFPPDRAAHTRPLEWSRATRRYIKRTAKKKAERASQPGTTNSLHAPPSTLFPPPPSVSLAGRFAWPQLPRAEVDAIAGDRQAV